MLCIYIEKWYNIMYNFENTLYLAESGNIMDFNEILTKIKADENRVNQTFSGNMTLYQRFLKKFPDDSTYASLCAAVDAGDTAQIEMGAHTLKGIAGNLGIGDLFALSTELLAEVRNGNKDITPTMEKLTAEYERVVSYIAQL